MECLAVSPPDSSTVLSPVLILANELEIPRYASSIIFHGDTASLRIVTSEGGEGREVLIVLGDKDPWRRRSAHFTMNQLLHRQTLGTPFALD